jgi:blocked-early-in-transport protein 1
MLTKLSRVRFGASSLHQRDPRSTLFEGYDNGVAERTRNGSASPGRSGYGVGYGYTSPAVSGSGSASLGVGGSSYRPATPNSRFEEFFTCLITLAERG